MLTKLTFAGGQKNSPCCSANSASSDGSYRTGDESAPYYPQVVQNRRSFVIDPNRSGKARLDLFVAELVQLLL